MDKYEEIGRNNKFNKTKQNIEKKIKDKGDFINSKSPNMG